MSEKNRDSKNRWRNVTIAFRMSPEEDAELDLRVKLCGYQTRQEYIIESVLHQKVTAVGNPLMLVQFRKQLKGIEEELKRLTTLEDADKITFSVNQLLSKKEHNNFKIEKIDTNNVYSITEFLEEPDIRGGSDSESESIDGDNMLFIKPDEANAIILKKGVAVTGYGIVEGKLHIQVRFSDILNTDNHGYVYLKNEDGKVVNCQSSVAFWDQSHVNSYEEFVFEVSAEELVNYEIWGEFWTCNNAPIEGEWQVTFPVEKNE